MKRTRVVEKKLGRSGALGLAYSDGEIEIDPRQPPREYLDTLIHEALHIALPDLTEEAVNSASRTISTTLWRQNVRRVSQ